MEKLRMSDPWLSGEPYEAFMGRWSRPVAALFLRWLDAPPEGRWLDVGCGTGALSESILAYAEPAHVVGLDFSPQFVAFARDRLAGERAAFIVSDGGALPLASGRFNSVVSGLALNFFPRPAAAVAEMARIVMPGGTVAAYVWDYAAGMQMLRLFWDAAVALDEAAAELDEGRRFPICQPRPLADLFEGAGLRNVQTQALEATTRFADFEDYWRPLLGGVGPVPGYIAGLGEEARAALRRRLQETLPAAQDGSITLTARAWAVRGLA